MEYRDPSRIVADGRGDPNDEVPPSRPRRLEFPRHPAGRLDARKVLAAVLLLSSASVATFYLGGKALDFALRWLHARPQYQLRFDRISLAEPVPSWFKGGTTAFLEAVRKNAGEPEVLSLLDVAGSPDEIDRAFKLYPWVERVESIEFPPRGLVVRLAYRRPVLYFLGRDGARILLDETACMLPPEDVQSDFLGTLIQLSLTGPGLNPPSPATPGRTWMTAADDRQESQDADDKVHQAARLAAFLDEPERRAMAEKQPELRTQSIAPELGPPNRGLFLSNAAYKGRAMILWGRGPGDEGDGEPRAAEKWELLSARVRKGGLRPETKAGFWAFTKSDLVWKPT